MARKNPFAHLMDGSVVSEPPPPVDYVAKGASRSLLSTIDEIAERADRLADAEAVLELDPNLVEPSFVSDRIGSEADDDAEFNAVLDAIGKHGQTTPILVKPHPVKKSHYMVIFGHRRLRAAKALGRKVRAIVRELSDRDHVVAQGQENSARSNLSFIEKVFFAANLERLGYDQTTVLAALSIDKTTLSKLLSVAAIPNEIVQGIGPAKGIGRDRWYELKQLLEVPANLETAKKMVSENELEKYLSDERFSRLLNRLKEHKRSQGRKSTQKVSWSAEDGCLVAEMQNDGKRFTLAVKAKGNDARVFGDYLSKQLPRIYQDFRQELTSTTNGD